MRVLITQSAPDAALSAHALSARGHAPVVVPLITVEDAAPDGLALAGAQGFIATGPAAVRALAARVGVRTFPLFVDGALAAAEAARAGFTAVHAAKDDAQDLARLVERTLKPAHGALIQACGTGAPAALPALLGNMGFAVRTVVLYGVRRAAAVPAALRAALADGGIDAAVFLSPDEARAFAALMQEDGAPSVAGLKTVAATPAVAAPLRALKGLRVAVAPAGDPESVWAMLDGALIDRVAQDREEMERQEKARAAQREKERIATERRAAEDAARAEAERKRRAEELAAREKAEAEKRAAEQREKERIATERRAAEDAARAEAERKRRAEEQAARDRADTVRRAAARAEQERLEAEGLAHAAEAAALREKERIQKDRAEKERVEKERAEQAARAHEAADRNARAKRDNARAKRDTPRADPRWTMTVGPVDAPAAATASPVAAGSATWNDTPMTETLREPQTSPAQATASAPAAPPGAASDEPPSVPPALAELNDLVERENAANRADGTTAARGGGRSARMQVEDAADARARDRLRTWGRAETPPASDPRGADIRASESRAAETPAADPAAPPARRRGSGRAAFLFLGLAAAVAAGLMTIDRWLPLVVGTFDGDAPLVAAAPEAARPETVSPAAAPPPPATETPAATPPVEAAAPTDLARVEPAPMEPTPVEPAPADPGLVAPALTGQAQQIAALTARVATLEAALGNAARLEDMNARVGALEGRSADASSVLALSERLRALEQGARTAADTRSAALALAIAGAQWRDALAAGRPFRREWETVKALGHAADGASDAAFATHADAGLPTLAEIQRRFGPAAAAAVRASIVPGDTSGWLRRTLDRALSIVTVRRTDVDAGDDVAAVLTRAERTLAAGDLAAAVAEMRRLTGPAAAAAAAWTDIAQARAAAEQTAQGAIMSAVAGLAAPPQPTAPAGE